MWGPPQHSPILRPPIASVVPSQLSLVWLRIDDAIALLDFLKRLRQYLTQLPKDFRCVSRVGSYHGAGLCHVPTVWAESRLANRDFLDPPLFNNLMLVPL